MLAAHAPAKVNLYLHITGARDDGYHEVDSLVVFADIGDRLTLQTDHVGEDRLSITGPFAAALSNFDVADNLVLRAADALAKHLGQNLDGLHFTLDKHLPLAGGIGGGSADAAAALRLLCGLWSVNADDAEVMALAASIGADLPACLVSKPVITRGIGEQLTPVSNLPALPAILVNPGAAQPTPAVFKARRDIQLPFDPEVSWPRNGFTDAQSVAAWVGANTTNGLDAPARSLAPVIGSVIDRIAATDGCQLARMSGSGSTCFGVYRTQNEAKAAAAGLQAGHPDWWVSATTLAA